AGHDLAGGRGDVTGGGLAGDQGLKAQGGGLGPPGTGGLGEGAEEFVDGGDGGERLGSFAGGQLLGGGGDLGGFGPIDAGDGVDRVAAFGRASAGEGDFLHEGGAAEFDVGGLEHGAVVEHVALRGQGAGRGQGDEQGDEGAGELHHELPPVAAGTRASRETR